jgi:hypothetical protein
LREYVDVESPEDVSTRYNLISHQWTAAIGLPFTGLRSTMATMADDWPDDRAVDVLMGHMVGKTGRQVRRKSYAKRFNSDRVRRFVEHIWPLFFEREAPSVPAGPLEGISPPETSAGHSSDHPAISPDPEN